MEILWTVLAIYLLIGVLISIVGRAWSPLRPGKTRGMWLLQLFFLVVLWLPSIILLSLKKEA